MVQNKVFGFGPAALSNAVANILNGAITSLAGPVGFSFSQPVIFLTRIRIIDKAGTGGTFQLFIGATGASAAGTEFLGFNTLVTAASFFEWVGRKRLDSTQFLTGKASAATTLTIEGDMEIGFS